MKHKSALTIQGTMHKRTSKNKTMDLEEEVFLPPSRASKQTSMSTLNNTSEALLFSCTLKKHLIHHNEDLPSW